MRVDELGGGLSACVKRAEESGEESRSHLVLGIIPLVEEGAARGRGDECEGISDKPEGVAEPRRSVEAGGRSGGSWPVARAS